MGKRRTTPEEAAPPAEPPKKRRNGTPIHFYAKDQLDAALKAYLASLRPKPTLTSVATLALEEFLERQGFWPPPKPEE